MKMTFSATLLAAVMLVASSAAPILAQDTNVLSGYVTVSAMPQPVNPDHLNPGPDAPQPQPGELVPLPGSPPEGQAAEIKLPNCTPPNCGVPDIMAQ